ncbi:putative membrane-bound dehydrogenase domain-containing protein [Singulisphaera sp. GP187]|uniref:PVC-type heme-binding CxxCH protein n=1 Tax=Singulisphaera sp. GP187 TaxID=1882752 RepID=UPI00092BEBE6|nr:PVC-type heme-binding CxxCH protein [Singulisphaera sp. GP187]SIO59058.1 putative membrane-bound dehydrogenase domain-containing protein [Singulisphaera sp. GP187]
MSLEFQAVRRSSCSAWGMLGALVALVLVAFGGASLAAPPAPKPLSPAEERTTFRLIDPKLRIDLIASEPAVASPVAIAWDENGRLFVVEMTDYPAGPRSGKLRMLEDLDRDGRYEVDRTFAEGLNFPSGVLPWAGGVLVTAAPDILFLKDNDGDGVADERRVVLTGFVEGNSQLRVNGLTWGADNWVYAANGRSDGSAQRPGEPAEKAVPLRRHDFRFRPETGEVEVVSGFSQFGLPRDDWGRRYPSWNTIPIRHAVIEEAVLSRNPYLAESASVAAILDPADGGRVFPISPAPTTYNRESTAYFNATCGPTIYRGDLMGDSYRGNAFVCESLTNLVQRRVLDDRGTTFLARRVEPDREFLASTDPAFRPVNLTTGPDGALYVVDFYREIVEHPQFVPEELRKSIEFRRWNNRGRLWRIANDDVKHDPCPPLGKASTAELVAALEEPNGWRRDTAQRLIVERHDREAIPALRKRAEAGSTPLGRIHAVWTLDGLGGLEDATLAKALSDASPGVRECAAKLAARRPGLADALVKAADDPELRVRFQVAIALGDLDDGRAPTALAKIAARDADDDWVRLAVLSGLGEKAWPFLHALLVAEPGWLAAPTLGQGRVLASTAAILGARNRPEELRSLAAQLTPAPGETTVAGRIALLVGLSDGLARAGRPLHELLKAGPATEGYEGIAALLDRAAKTVASAEASPADRAQSLTLLARCRPEAAAVAIPALLHSVEADVQSAAARAVAEVGSAELAGQILDEWASLPTRSRREVLTALTSSVRLADRLVTAIEDDVVSLTELAPADRDALRLTPDAALRGRVEKRLAASAPQDRTAVVKKFQPVLDLTGDARRGGELFAKNCQTCHQRQGRGFRVGPDLSGVAGRPPSALLKDMLDPNADVSPDFSTYLVVTQRGQTLSGLLAEETASSLKLRGAEGVEQSVLRSEIEVLRPSGRTLMPEGLEEALGMQGLADLIAFLKQP